MASNHLIGSGFNTTTEIPFNYLSPINLLRQPVTLNLTCDINGAPLTINSSGVEILMPDKSSSLVWCTWPAVDTNLGNAKDPLDSNLLIRPIVNTDNDYQKIVVLGRTVQQPRKTLCYGVSYTYSGTPHKLESVTPAPIQLLMDISAALYNLDGNESLQTMCLTNIYHTGHHCIGAHSDDERQFGYINDVLCWVIGSARELRITDKKTGKLIIKAHLPEGIYIMKGRSFQHNYKHEIPRLLESQFKLFCKIYPEDCGLSSMEKADWLSTDTNVKDILMDIGGEKLVDKFNQWNQKRISHTIRFFKKNG